MQIGHFIPKLDLVSISFSLLHFRYPLSVSWQSLCIFNIIILFIYPSVHCSSCVLWPRVDCNERYSSRTKQELTVPLTLLETKPSKPRNNPKAPVTSRNRARWVEGTRGEETVTGIRVWLLIETWSQPQLLGLFLPRSLRSCPEVKLLIMDLLEIHCRFSLFGKPSGCRTSWWAYTFSFKSC